MQKDISARVIRTHGYDKYSFHLGCFKDGYPDPNTAYKAALERRGI